MPGEKQPPPEAQEAALAQEMRAAYPAIAKYLDGKVEGLEEAVESGKVARDSHRKRIAEATTKAYFVDVAERNLERSGLELFEAKEAKRDFEKGEIHEAAKILLEDIKDLFFSLEVARSTGNASYADQVRENIKASLSALNELLKDRPSAK